jgi:SlyX protein
MTDKDRLSERVDALEARIAYQDDTIETLNQTVTAQWQQIDALRRLVAELGDRLRDAESNSRIGPANEPPPHY